MITDPASVLLLDTPPEWKLIPQEILDRLVPKRGIYTRNQMKQMDGIAHGRWFLVTNELRARCRSCRVGRIPGAIHPYLTTACVPSPFNGLTDVVGVIESHQDRDVIWSGIRFGSIVPISETDAQRFLRQIRAKGHFAPGLGRIA